METERFSINSSYYFRFLSESDVTQKYLNWLSDIEVTEFLEVRHTKYNISDIKTYIKSFKGSTSKYLFGIFSHETNEHIGNVSIYNINKKTGVFDFGYLIGNKNHWGSDAGITTILFSLHYAFDELDLVMLKSGVYSNHVKSRFLLKKIGCTEFERVEGKFLYNKKPITEVIYSMSNKEWSSVKEKYEITAFKECF